MVLLTLRSIINNVCIYASAYPIGKHKNQLHRHFNTKYGVCQMQKYNILCINMLLLIIIVTAALEYGNGILLDLIHKAILVVDPSAPFAAHIAAQGFRLALSGKRFPLDRF